MLQDWEDGFIGNNPSTTSRLAPRASLAQVMVRAFEPILLRQRRENLRRAA